MLTLPENWRVYVGGAIFKHLYEQVPKGELQLDVAKHFINACLELATAGISKRWHTSMKVICPSDLAWKIGNHTYLYFHDIDNRALRKATELRQDFNASILVQPAHEEVLWRACLQVMGKRAPSIIAIDSLINMRMLFSSADFDWSYEQVVLDLLHRYNRHVAETKQNTIILADIPPE